MSQHNPISNFTLAQTPQAGKIQSAALWVSERIHTGITGGEAASLRGHLLFLATQVESVELTLIDALHKVMDMAEEREAAAPAQPEPAAMAFETASEGTAPTGGAS